MIKTFNRIFYILSPHMVHDRNSEEYTMLDVLDYLNIMGDGKLTYSLSSTGYLIKEVSHEEYARGEREEYLIRRINDKYGIQQYDNSYFLEGQKEEYLESLLIMLENIEK